MANQEKIDSEDFILCSIVKVDNHGPSSYTSKETNKSRSSGPLIKLHRSIDPNLGLTGYLSPLNLQYEAKMNQPWNMAPYFLDVLSQSPCCELSDCILLFGGLDPARPDDLVLGSSVFEYHVAYKKWRYYGCMLEPRCYHQASKIDSFVYVTGGYSPLVRCEGEMVAISKTQRLDTATTMWQECADMKVARASHAMAVCGGCLYVFGGRDSSGNILTSVEKYDPEENGWSVVSQLPVPLMGLSATATLDARIWLAGGITVLNDDYERPSVTDSLYSFSPLDGSWHTHPPLPYPHAFSSCVSDGGDLWLVGGSHLSKSKALVSCPCIWQLRPGASRWEKVGYLTTPTHASATVWCGDSIVSMGGVSPLTHSTTNVVQVLNLRTSSSASSSLPAQVGGSSVVYFPRKDDINEKVLRRKDVNRPSNGKKVDKGIKTNSASNLSFIYVKESSSKQYVTSIKIPLNGAKLMDTEGHFRLYSPPPKWKGRTASF